MLDSYYIERVLLSKSDSFVEKESSKTFNLQNISIADKTISLLADDGELWTGRYDQFALDFEATADRQEVKAERERIGKQAERALMQIAYDEIIDLEVDDEDEDKEDSNNCAAFYKSVLSAFAKCEKEKDSLEEKHGYSIYTDTAWLVASAVFAKSLDDGIQDIPVSSLGGLRFILFGKAMIAVEMLSNISSSGSALHCLSQSDVGKAIQLIEEQFIAIE